MANCGRGVIIFLALSFALFRVGLTLEHDANVPDKIAITNIFFIIYFINSIISLANEPAVLVLSLFHLIIRCSISYSN